MPVPKSTAVSPPNVEHTTETVRAFQIAMIKLMTRRIAQALLSQTLKSLSEKGAERG